MYDVTKPTEEQVKLRAQAYKILYSRFPDSPKDGNIYKCIDEWLLKGQVTTNGIVQYYDAYYNKKGQ